MPSRAMPPHSSTALPNAAGHDSPPLCSRRAAQALFLQYLHQCARVVVSALGNVHGRFLNIAGGARHVIPRRLPVAHVVSARDCKRPETAATLLLPEITEADNGSGIGQQRDAGMRRK